MSYLNIYINYVKFFVTELKDMDQNDTQSVFNFFPRYVYVVDCVDGKIFVFKRGEDDSLEKRQVNL